MCSLQCLKVDCQSARLFTSKSQLRLHWHSVSKRTTALEEISVLAASHRLDLSTVARQNNSRVWGVVRADSSEFTVSAVAMIHLLGMIG